MAKKLRRLNFVDLFSGAGGISCGLELAGMNCVLGVDHDRYATETFALNHKNAKVYCGDITKLNKPKLQRLIGNKKVDLVVGGPPCQGFSTVGKGDPNDIRNKLFLQFVRIVKELDPTYVVIENVTGLVAKKNEKTLRAIFSRFTKLGFVMDVRVLESQHYGVAEKRKRTILIGSKVNDEIIFPKKITDTVVGNTSISAVTIGEVISNLNDEKGVTHNHDIKSAHPLTELDLKRIKKIPEGKGIRYEKDEKAYLPPRLRLGVNWEKMRENRFRQTKYYRLDSNRPSPTIMTHRHTYYHPTKDRYLTQREAAAIQSFPNDFIFVGPLTSQWRQIGNAVPPKMAYAIGLSILEMAKKSSSKRVSTTKSRKLNESLLNIRSGAFKYREKTKDTSPNN